MLNPSTGFSSTLSQDVPPPATPEGFFKNKRVLITGGAGFIGKALCTRMQSLGAVVVIIDLCACPAEISAQAIEWHQGDCTDMELLARVTPECEVVFNLARQKKCYQVFHQFVVRSPARDILASELGSHGIGHGVHYPRALSQQRAYQSFGRGRSFPVAERLAGEVLSLPLHPWLTKEAALEVISILDRTWRKK
ncbi:MAG: NAD-dependent epimerase/dehydratase family protein [Verrucomicrobia bacterium]|nr:NAD-dependent epimerase/dehydratase family protein [Verrucomicrobiota bacterium]